MKNVLEYLHNATRKYEKHDFFRYLENSETDALEQLAIFKQAAFFIMAFGDINAFGLRERSSHDTWQKMVNRHTTEDDHHWPWYLADIKSLGLDSVDNFTATLTDLWSKNTLSSRLLTYRLWSLIERTRSFERFVVVEAVEATGFVLFSRLNAIAHRVLADSPDIELIYFGDHHFEKEKGHAMGDGETRNAIIDTTTLNDAEIARAFQLVDEVFALFTSWIDGLSELTAAAGRAEPACV